MRRWLSTIKRHLTPGVWAKPAKQRRPITMMPDNLMAPALPPRAARPKTLCDTDIILSRYREGQTLTRMSSQVLPLEDLDVSRETYVRCAFISFEPTYIVTVCEENPYQLAMHKPRPKPFRNRLINSFIRETRRGEI